MEHQGYQQANISLFRVEVYKHKPNRKMQGRGFIIMIDDLRPNLRMFFLE